jgi:hypothetical protein
MPFDEAAGRPGRPPSRYCALEDLKRYAVNLA